MSSGKLIKNKNVNEGETTFGVLLVKNRHVIITQDKDIIYLYKFKEEELHQKYIPFIIVGMIK